MLTDVKTAETRCRARLLWRLGCASLFLAMLALAGTSWVVYSNWSDSKQDAEYARSNRAYLRNITNLLAHVTEAESGQRGYLLTGRERYLEPYRKSLEPIEKQLAGLSEIAKKRPDQRENIDLFEVQTRIKMSELAKTIELFQSQGSKAALDEVLTDKGNAAMSEIRDAALRITDEQSRINEERTRQAQQHQQNAIIIATSGGLLISILMIAGFSTLISGANRQTQLAERLAASRQIFETTLTSIGDGVLATDTSGKITFINPEAAKLTGWTREQAIGQPLPQVFRIVNEASRQVVESPFEKVMRTGSVVGLANHTTLIRQDGSEVPIDDSGAPIRHSDGQISGVVLVFRDVQERRKAEADLAHSHSEVLKANEELRQFSYAATHDLQEPLRTIVVFGQLLSRGYKELLDERGQHLIQTVEEAAQRMSMLIDDLLAYTRAGSVEASTNRSPVNAAAILQDTLIQLHGSIEETGAQITFADLPVVITDGAQLSQVFQNLISNAIKYRKPDTSPVIHISASLNGDRATFQISDNGMGFKQEYSDRIFLLFQRLHGRSIPGTGIGLALCRRIIERHGGRIWARSEENVGTSFFFTLPLAVEKVASA